jgi:CBS domain-containing protein
MRVEEIMSDAECCHPGDSVRDCARLMRDEDIGFVPICNDRNEPLGAITDRDLAIRVLAEGKTGDERCESIMTRDVVSCRAGDDVRECERQMREHRTSRVMVCDEQGKLCGVVSLADVAQARSDDATGETLQAVKSDEPTQPTAH